MKTKSFALILLCFFSATVSFAQTSVMDFYNAKLEAMSKWVYPNQTKPAHALTLTQKDIANGYLAYTYTPALGYLAGVTNSPEQMAYFTAQNGKKFVAIASFVCLDGEACRAEMPKFLTLENGGLVDKTDKYLPANVAEQIEDAVSEKRGKVTFQVGTAVKLPMWVKLPQVGTTIQIGVQEFGDERFKFYLACELTYNETNGTFTFVKK